MVSYAPDACEEMLDLSAKEWYAIAGGMQEEAADTCDTLYEDGSEEAHACRVGAEAATGISAVNNACQEIRQ